MKTSKWLIPRYILSSVLPYFLFTWLLLSVILFVQQASRYYDIFFSVNIPANLISQLTLALVPNVIAFTCPMAVLIGIIIGLSKMQGDNEITALRAAGIGNLQIALPLVLIGILLSVFAFTVNLKGVPLAAQIVRQIALRTALYKLESPIEPGVFNTEINGYTIYVKDGNLLDGSWRKIFVFNRDADTDQTRLITSESGRIDSRDDSSELVLENSNATTFSENNAENRYISENVGQLRLAIKTKKGDLIEKLSGSDRLPEELGFSELSKYVGAKEGREKIEAQVLWYRRIILSATPLIFALLGTALVLRFSKGGRKFGIFLALISLIAYYLLALLGEQLARTETLSAAAGGLLPVVICTALIVWLFWSKKITSRNFFARIYGRVFRQSSDFRSEKGVVKLTKKRFGSGVTTNILDFDIVINLLKYVLLTLGFLISIYMIFTAFELWKFAGTIDHGFALLLKYLIYLLPYVYIQLAPSALMIAILATYVIKSRQNEIVTWIATGRSVYRLLLPCFLLMMVFGFINWQIQETVAPKYNRIQDDLRTQIRSRGLTAQREGKYWVSNRNRIYSFETDKNAADVTRDVKNLSVFEFTEDNRRLKYIYRAAKATWQADKIEFDSTTQKNELIDGIIKTTVFERGELPESSNPFVNLYKKPTHLNSTEIETQIQTSESDVERRSYQVASEKKRATLLLPLIIAIFTAPLALSLSRKGKVITVGYAVGLWLLFLGLTNVFEQFGLNGYLSPTFAVWSPMAFFALVGVYLLFRVKT